MSDPRSKQIQALIERLINDLKVAESHSLELTVRLLQIAILDLRTVQFSISDADLRYLTEALEEELESGPRLSAH